MTDFSDLPWGNIIKAKNEGNFKGKLPNKSILGYAIDESHYPTVVEAALKALRKIDPTRANLEQAVKIADRMKTFAKNMLGK